jgi:hypothetical protein
VADSAELRRQMFRAAHDYHDAAARYCRAWSAEADIETPTQVLLGKSLFYYLALSKLLAAESSESVQRRLRYLRETQKMLARRYDLVKQRRR